MTHCQDCDQPARVRVTEIVHGEKHELSLCSNCARRRGVLTPASASISPAAPTAESRSRSLTLRCAHCGTSVATMRRQGRVGCPHCYRSFRPQLRRLLQRIHGETRHRTQESGPSPQALRTLRGQLREAIEREEYERAAQLRDRIARGEGPSPETQAKP